MSDPDELLFNNIKLNLLASEVCCDGDTRKMNECYSDYARLNRLRLNAVCKRIQRDKRGYQ